MAMKNCIVLIIVGIIACLLSLALAVLGIATFYTSYTPYYHNQPQGVMIAAANDSIWNNGAICGKIFNVRCTKPRNPVPHPCTSTTVKVKIVDYCPGCPPTFDLSREAFTQITNPVAGIINIDYTPA